MKNAQQVHTLIVPQVLARIALASSQKTIDIAMRAPLHRLKTNISIRPQRNAPNVLELSKLLTFPQHALNAQQPKLSPNQFVLIVLELLQIIFALLASQTKLSSIKFVQIV